jgi:putative membrane protein
MIDYNSKVWFRHILKLDKTDTFRILGWEMLIVGIYTGLLAAVELEYLKLSDAGALAHTTTVHSILGFVLSLLLVFRTNTAYDRWWEGRKLWGSLVNNTRNLAIKIDAMVPAEDDETRTFFSKMIPNFPLALRNHLRDGVDFDDLEDVNAQMAKWKEREHVPAVLIQDMYHKVKQLYKDEKISGDEFIILDKELKSFSDIMGACERILKTPIPYSYSIFLKKFIFFYILTLPLGFIAFFGYWAIPISIFVFYVLVSLEILAEEIEDPFGHDANDLPTNRLAFMMKDNVREIFGKKD